MVGTIFHEHGYWWPVGCKGKTDRWMRHEKDSDAAVRLIPKKRRRTCVQAGGNMGLWPLRLAEKFQRVITFEPEDANWECLRRNCQNEPKIEAHKALLGERVGTGSLLFNHANPGGHKSIVTEGYEPRDIGGKYEQINGLSVVAIDNYQLDDVDLIYLDIEGAELPALRGASETVQRCRPVIVYEERGHGQLFGYEPKDTERWLKRMGYRFHSRVSKDRIWLPC